MAKQRLTCRECHFVVEPNVQNCPNCGSSSLTEDWAGYVIIAHPERSEIAEKMEITTAGKYALKVR